MKIWGLSPALGFSDEHCPLNMRSQIHRSIAKQTQNPCVLGASAVKKLDAIAQDFAKVGG